jgi:hypothetical protein
MLHCPGPEAQLLIHTALLADLHSDASVLNNPFANNALMQECTQPDSRGPETASDFGTPPYQSPISSFVQTES